MKVRIQPIDIPLPDFCDEEYKRMYIIEYRFHWWQRWKHILDPRTKVPELFESHEEINDKLNSLGFEEKY